jgi:hypothetical protein
VSTGWSGYGSSVAVAALDGITGCALPASGARLAAHPRVTGQATSTCGASGSTSRSPT